MAVDQEVMKDASSKLTSLVNDMTPDQFEGVKQLVKFYRDNRMAGYRNLLDLTELIVVSRDLNNTPKAEEQVPVTGKRSKKV